MARGTRKPAGTDQERQLLARSRDRRMLLLPAERHAGAASERRQHAQPAHCTRCPRPAPHLQRPSRRGAAENRKDGMLLRFSSIDRHNGEGLPLHHPAAHRALCTKPPCDNAHQLAVQRQRVLPALNMLPSRTLPEAERAALSHACARDELEAVRCVRRRGSGG
jgi:hypothetical protein